MPEKDKLGSERRHYLRLDTVFPVHFYFIGEDGKNIFPDIFLGFTSDIGKGGICLEAHNLKADAANIVNARSHDLSLAIKMPFADNPVLALAKISWVDASQVDSRHRLLIGLKYKEIDLVQNIKIMRYAWAKKIFVPAVLSIVFILGLCFAFDSYMNTKLIKGNKAIVEELITIMQDSSLAKQKIKLITKEKDDLQSGLTALEARINAVEEEKEKLAKEARERAELNALVDTMLKEKGSLQEQLISAERKESDAAQELSRLDQKKENLTLANLEKMYQWLKIHQNPRTGLVMSYEGDNQMSNYAFVYDQALMINAYTYFSDFDRAKKVLDFFQNKAKRSGTSFFNAYYSNDGLPAEYVIHSGPNLWLGMAALQYTQKTNDRQFLVLAEDIAKGIIAIQSQGGDDGIKGGPDVSWYSTEHNLDAYAFFNMLYKVTQNQKYQQEQAKILNWLLRNTYDSKDIPIKRGKGDATIATDTYAWSISTIGPRKLQDIGMDPDKILEFAEQNCLVHTDYARPDGVTIKVKGFDFAAQRNLSRGGVVSTEWTAQMILAFKIMADYYNKKEMAAKAQLYEAKANEYLAGLASMIISSPSPSGQGDSCLPYATQDMADTGHGWATPQGKSTGSVAGTAWALFAYYNYNPLEIK